MRADIYLGVDWMYNFSPIIFDFKQLQVKMLKEHEEIILEGAIKNLKMKLVKVKGAQKFRKQRMWELAAITIGLNIESESILTDVSKLIEQNLQMFSSTPNFFH